MENMNTPRAKTGVHKLFELVNYYCNILSIRSHMLQYSTILTYAKVGFKWTEVEYRVFDKVKKMCFKAPY